MATFSPISGVDASVAPDLVAERFGLSENLVEQYDEASTSALDALAAYTISIPTGDLELADSTLSVPTVGDAPIPNTVTTYTSQAQAVVLSDIAALRATLELVDATIEQTTLPTFTEQAPTITFPTAPDDVIPDVPSDVPNISEVSLPAVPTIDLPTVPTLDEVTIPSAPEISTVVFDAEVPTADLTPPEPMFVYTEGTYSSDVADALRTKLYNDLLLGGTGLSAEVEADIWARMVSRLDVELDKMHQQVLTNWEAWNCEMPDGILSSALQEIAYESARNRTDQNRDITYKQAELAQQQTQFAITSGLVMEKQLMDFSNQVAQRAFEAARYRVQAVIDAFNLKVNAYQARVEGYRVLAQVFESRIRAELAKVELYRAQMEGAKIHGELQLQKVQIYSARIDALKTLISLYTAQIEGAKLQLSADQLKLEATKTKIEAVVAQINGITSKYNLYQAQLAGEATKVDLYGKQVSAYATQVQATKVISDISLAEAQIAIDGNKDKIAVLTAALDKYKADVQYELGKDDTGSRVYSAQVQGYTAEVDRESKYLTAKIDVYKAQVEEVIGRAELIVKELDANLQAAGAANALQVEALKAAAIIQAQKVASALTSVSASAQVGFNASISDSYANSQSDTWIYSQNQSENTNHNYNYSE